MSRPRIACCMIVRDAADTIELAIGSVLPHVDAVLVFDTGSTDGTVELLRAIEGVTVEEGSWRDDFSWAREQSFAMARATHDHGSEQGSEAEGFDWILRHDADEELLGGEHLRGLAEHPTADGFAFRHETDPNDPPAHPVRFVRVASRWRWQDPCHETLVHPDPAIELCTEISVLHHNTAGNPQRNLRILLGAEEAGYESSRFDLILGLELAAAGRDDEAIERLAKWIEDATPSTFVDNGPPIVIAAAYSTTAIWLRERARVLEAMKYERLALSVLIAAAEAGTPWTAYPPRTRKPQAMAAYNPSTSGNQKVKRMKAATTT